MKRQHLQILCAWALMASGLTTVWAGPLSCLEKADLQKPEMEQFIVDKPIFDEREPILADMDKDLNEKPTFEKAVFEPIRFQKGERDYCGTKRAGVWTVEVKDTGKAKASNEQAAFNKLLKQQAKSETVKVGRDKVRVPALGTPTSTVAFKSARVSGCGCETAKPAKASSGRLVVTK